MSVSSNTYLTTGAMSTLPNGNSPHSISGWVRCPVDQKAHTLALWGTPNSDVSRSQLSVGNYYYKSWAAQPYAVSTFAGSRSNIVVTTNLDGTGTNAAFHLPIQIATDSKGNIWMADYGYGLVRKITPSGVTTTEFGSTPGCRQDFGLAAQMQPWGLAVDAFDNIWIGDIGCHSIKMINSVGYVMLKDLSSLHPSHAAT